MLLFFKLCKTLGIIPVKVLLTLFGGSLIVRRSIFLISKQYFLMVLIYLACLPMSDDASSREGGDRGPVLVLLTLFSPLVYRMFTTFPKTKTYFSHLDISPNSDHLRCHGKKIVQALADGARNISTLATTLAPLSRFHAYLLRIHPTNFKVFMKHMST